MSTQKLSLKNLKVKSFVTADQEFNTATVKGGEDSNISQEQTQCWEDCRPVRTVDGCGSGNIPTWFCWPLAY